MLNIYWFRKDLRLNDNRGLSEFVKAVKEPVNDSKFLVLYILNDRKPGYYGEKRLSFLYESLNDLKENLSEYGIHLHLAHGKSKYVFQSFVKSYGNIRVFANKQVEPYCISRDNEVNKITGGNLLLFDDTTIFQPGEVIKDNGKPYTVFTPFKNKAMTLLNDSHTDECRTDFRGIDSANELRTEDYCFDKSFGKHGILKSRTGGDVSLIQNQDSLISGGRKEGLRLLENFLKNGLLSYKSRRDYPWEKGTSLLSAHLHFGTVGIREAIRPALKKMITADEDAKIEITTWINELLWREFYYNITYHFPHIIEFSFRKEFDKLQWNDNDDDFRRWCEGKTGYPIVDAAMRQLNETGLMHNRLRMVTAMFLTKDLFIDWRKGEKYFAERLIDLDLSSNNGGWQWSASTGCDAQPYFRIFNPVLQSKKFDAEGIFIKSYVPELKNLPVKFIHSPWEMDVKEQKLYNVTLGNDYPLPVVEHGEVRDRVIREFKKISD